ncbi:hypothetical protein [Nocardia carnea]|uniref:hypothetical protein n=1 Tax=Nocardia carnea TaxID=37328 RepID=UPI002458F040|nr:hypothetical protein [Nocardia carnea]
MSIENRLTVLEAQVVQLINERAQEPESVRILRARTNSNHGAVMGELGSLHADIQDLQAGQARLETGQAQLRADVQGLRAGQARLETGQAQLRADVQDLQAGQARLEAGHARLEAGQAELRTDVTALQQGQDAIMEKLAEILSKLP